MLRNALHVPTYCILECISIERVIMFQFLCLFLIYFCSFFFAVACIIVSCGNKYYPQKILFSSKRAYSSVWLMYKNTKHSQFLCYFVRKHILKLSARKCMLHLKCNKYNTAQRKNNNKIYTMVHGPYRMIEVYLHYGDFLCYVCSVWG